jgi:hypothetical protein
VCAAGVSAQRARERIAFGDLDSDPGAGKAKLFMALEFNLRFVGFAFVTLGCLSCMG